MDDDSVEGLQKPEVLQTKTSQRRIQGWLFVCGEARVLISWTALAIGAGAGCSSFIRANTDDFSLREWWHRKRLCSC